MKRTLTCAAASIGFAMGPALSLAAEPAPAGATPSQQTLPTIVVEGTREAEDYRVEAVDSLGPMGKTPILDTPYSVAVLPQDAIQNSQAVSFKDVSKYLPLVAYQEQQGPDVLRPQTRGMQGGNFQNTRIDGMTMFITTATAMEQFQQIEVVNGPSSFLYGPANPAGMFNFISKRPTQEALREISLSYTSDSVATAKVDLSGKIDDGGIFSYRVNGIYGKGDGYVDDSHQRRRLADLGLDIRPFEHAVLELNYSDYKLVNKGYPGWFTYGQAIDLPAPPDPERVGYGQSYAGVDLGNRLGTARFKYELNAHWHLVAGVLNQDAERDINTVINNLTSNAGAYTSSFANGFSPRFRIVSGTAYLNGDFSIWGTDHDFTFGTADYRASSYAITTAATAASVRLGTANIDSPVVYAEPAAGPPDTDLNFRSSVTYQRGLNVSDSVAFNRYWSVRAAISQDWFQVNNRNAQGTLLTGYDSHGLSPTGSILFKPLANMTGYITYASSLQVGDLAPGTAANAGTNLAPYRSTEYELGYKANFSKINLTAAVFRIERPFANIDSADHIYKISGKQVNKGLELSAVGVVLPRLTVYGGLTLLNARLEDTPLASTDGKTYVGAPKIKGNVLFEYSVRGLTGLVTTLNYQFSGHRAANDTNTQTAPGYNLLDVGVRYATSLSERPVTLRLAVNNVTDQHYWSTIGPSNLTGANTGSLLAHLGSPRTVLASASINL